MVGKRRQELAEQIAMRGMDSTPVKPALGQQRRETKRRSTSAMSASVIARGIGKRLDCAQIHRDGGGASVGCPSDAGPAGQDG
jgi:hypothetical protein